VFRPCGRQRRPSSAARFCAQVRFRLQLAVQLASLAASLALPPAVCRAAEPGGAPTLRCLAGLYGAQALLGFALPAVVVHQSERRFRHNFVIQLHQA